MGSPEEQVMKAGLEALTRPIREFLSKVAGAPAEELGQLLTDRVRFRRFRNQVRMLECAQSMLAEAGIEPTEVPLRVLVPLLDGASWEENQSISDRWAALLANAARDDAAVPPAFPEILRQLRPVEAQMLDHIYDRSGSRTPSEVSRSTGFTTGGFEHYFDLPSGSISQSSLENLVRLGLCFFPSEPLGRMRVDRSPLQRRGIHLTQLGVEFVEACRAPAR